MLNWSASIKQFDPEIWNPQQTISLSRFLLLALNGPVLITEHVYQLSRLKLQLTPLFVDGKFSQGIADVARRQLNVTGQLQPDFNWVWRLSWCLNGLARTAEDYSGLDFV